MLNGVNGPGRLDMSGLGPDMFSLVRTCPATCWICSVKIDPLGKILINHILLIETLSNLTQ
jgi:hypothetical protein